VWKGYVCGWRRRRGRRKGKRKRKKMFVGIGGLAW
jgi:hypothetical protein